VQKGLNILTLPKTIGNDVAMTDVILSPEIPYDPETVVWRQPPKQRGPNFSSNTGQPAPTNPCNTSVIRKIFKRPQALQWNTVEKKTNYEIIFRTMNPRNRLMPR
jgi:hypothetical protein